MALQTSGAITLSQIATEFGGSSPHSMSEYRGVDGTPSTGAISFSNFYGKSSWIVNISPSSSARTGIEGYALSDSFSASPTGGSSPYSYSWSVNGGASISGSSTSQTVTITQKNHYPSTSTGTVTCTVNGSTQGQASYDFTWNFDGNLN